MRWILLIGCLAACKRGGGEDDTVTSVVSASRPDSPISMTTFDLATKAATMTDFVYGRSGSCRLPRAVAQFGIVGCPMQVVRVAGKVEDQIPIEYDETFRLIVFDQVHYEWDGNDVKGAPKVEAELRHKGARLTEIIDAHHHSYLEYDGDPPPSYPEAK